MDKMTLYLIIVLAPLVGSLIAGLAGKKIGRVLTHSIAILGLLISTFLSLLLLYGFTQGTEPVFNENLYTWLTIGKTEIAVGFWVDQLTAVMMAVVTSVSLMVHIYTIGYMADDPGYQRFFSYISLFTFAMLVLLMSNNFVQLFFGWEGVGLVSYLLIGFWFKRPTAIFANLKAFLVNRAGDFGLLLGIGLIFTYFTPTLDYASAFAAAPALKETVIDLLPGWSVNLLTATCILLFIGAMAKSAQFPLHIWLPDSMEGPTPISALIHAATMVTAGIFMVARMSPLFELSNTALILIVVLGSITALFMGLLGLVQNDIKRVIAYSTLSQLGYMVVALGVSAYSAGLFHVVTHAFFKALLFLGAGSVIIGMHHDQDMRHMGGLYKFMPVTWITMLLASLSLIGTPFFSGFYSKDTIIEAVGLSSLPFAGVAYWCLVASVFVTALYSFRLYFLVFHGPNRWKEKNAEAESQHTAGEEHVGLDPAHNPKESPWVMTLPLILLAIPSVAVGFFIIEPLLYGNFLGQSIYVNSTLHSVMNHLSEEFTGPMPMALTSAKSLPLWLALAGVVTAYILYQVKPAWPQVLKTKFSALYRLLDRKYYIDDLYYLVFITGAQKLGRFFWKVGDVFIIDRELVNGSARWVLRTAMGLKKLQTGYIYTYATAMVMGLVILIVYWFYPVIIKTFI